MVQAELMATSQAFRVALHIPVTPPATGEVVTVQAPGGATYPSYWSAGGSAGAMTPATAQYQMLVSGPSPAYAWVAVDVIDCGVY